MSLRLPALARVAVAAALALLVLAGYAGIAPAARADSAPADPAHPATPATVAADALPTVQINGVVWSQTVVGNTVYAAGSFTRARPAGSAAGTNETVRNNLLAYDIRTGALITSFAPDLNAQAMVVTASPDGSRIYVGGDFTVANGQPRYGIAAYSTATGQLLDNFRPVIGSQVRAIAVTSTTVYVGGWQFGSAGGAARGHLAAFDVATGQVTSWAPDVNNTVNALAVVNNGTAVVIAGAFASLNGTTVGGIGSVSATTGQNLPFAASSFTRNSISDSAFTSLSTDADTVYATAFTFSDDDRQRLEGMLAINPQGGAVRWVDDCRGDSYSVWASGTVAYLAGHPHVCSNIGGFPQVNPGDQSKWTWYRALAFSKAAVNTVGGQTGNFAGSPAPELLNFFPAIDSGTYTGQYQGPWSVAGNSQYVVYGGEFPTVNGTMQQGLVRFAVPAIAPNKVGPVASAGLTPTLSSPSSGTVRVSWQTTSDQDNATLTYDVYRSDRPGSPVYSTAASSTFWAMPTLSFRDQTAPAGRTVSYSVTARDAFGNAVTGGSRSIAVSSAAGTTPDDYAARVLADGPASYWRFGETSGSRAADLAGNFDLTLGSGVALNRAGALTGRTDRAAAFNGTSSGIASTQTQVTGPDVMSIEGWFSTTSTSGGQLIGLGDRTTGLSTNHDRFIALTRTGQVTFNVWPARTATVASPAGYNDGKWHHVVATLSPSGMALYLDGRLVGTATGTTSGQPLSGYWRIGGDTQWDGTGPYLQTSVDEVAVYSTALTAAQVTAHYRAGTTTTPVNVPPTAAFTATPSGLTVAVDGSSSTDPEGPIASYAWDFGDGSTGTGRTASRTYATAGTYTVRLTVTDSAGATATVTRVVTVSAPLPPGTALATDAFGREVTGGWGSADLGGAWTIDGAAANATVTGGSGRLTSAKGTNTAALLAGSVRDASLTADVMLTGAPTGSGSFLSLGVRSSGATRYDAQLSYAADGTVSVGLVSVVNWNETFLASETLPTGYTPGTVLKVRFESIGTGTTTLRARVWASGTAEPAAWQVTATDGAAALQAGGGVYVGLYTAGDATATQTVRVDDLALAAPGGGPSPVDTAPVAAFTSTVNGLTAAVDASTSSDADGPIASYAWDFGDGSTGTGRTASRTYASAGTYPVTLTVTDSAGARATVTSSVTVTAPPPPAGAALASDGFDRSVTSGFGLADIGGTWSVFGTAANASVTSGYGRLTSAAGTTTGASLGVSARDVALQADVTLERAPAGAGAYVSLSTRYAGATKYNTQLYYATDGTVIVSLVAVKDFVETELASYTLPGTYTPGTVLTVRTEAVGTGATTLSAKAWTAGTTEPTGWQLTATDTTAGLQVAGGLAVELYAGGRSTSAPVVRFDNLWAGAAGTTP